MSTRYDGERLNQSLLQTISIEQAMPELAHLLTLRPSKRLNQLAIMHKAAGIPPVFGYQDIQPWFADLNDKALRVFINRHCRQRDIIEPLCQGVYRFIQLDMNREQVLLGAMPRIRPTDNFYLSMHSALELNGRQNLSPIVVAICTGRTNVFQVGNYGHIVFKATKVNLDKRWPQTTWDKRHQLYMANPELAERDKNRYYEGVRSLLDSHSDSLSELLPK